MKTADILLIGAGALLLAQTLRPKSETETIFPAQLSEGVAPTFFELPPLLSPETPATTPPAADPVRGYIDQLLSAMGVFQRSDEDIVTRVIAEYERLKTEGQNAVAAVIPSIPTPVEVNVDVVDEIVAAVEDGVTTITETSGITDIVDRQYPPAGVFDTWGIVNQARDVVDDVGETIAQIEPGVVSTTVKTVGGIAGRQYLAKALGSSGIPLPGGKHVKAMGKGVTLLAEQLGGGAGGKGYYTRGGYVLGKAMGKKVAGKVAGKMLLRTIPFFGWALAAADAAADVARLGGA
ncbi:hypothetical protein CMI37_27175, partial [Candidatus Pacearchaeota archaeon]|nr:hypothetical protein [Candidatus Pacearchaeota archaeon]